MTEKACKAKDPRTCPYHGAAARTAAAIATKNFDGYLKEKTVTEVKPARVSPFAHLNTEMPLKEMDPLMLSNALYGHLEHIPEVDVETMREAVAFASFVHRKDTRKNRAGFPTTAYIEHPLRNAIRLTRFGCRSQPALIAALLHDTVEDHASEIAENFGGGSTGNEAQDREIAFAFIGETFGEETERTVRGMSNPLMEDGISDERKRELYVEHVVEATREDPQVLVNKIMDWMDNALSLKYTISGMKPARTVRLIDKYSPLPPVFLEHLDLHAGRLPVSAEGLAAIRSKIAEGAHSLQKLRVEQAA